VESGALVPYTQLPDGQVPLARQVGGLVQSVGAQQPDNGTHVLVVPQTCSPGGQVQVPASQNSPVSVQSALEQQVPPT
jgi:hypothetical protein